MLLAYGMSPFLVNPLGSKRTCENFSTSVSRGTPYCSDIEIDVAKASMRPEIVEPSWPAIENLWVIECRSSGSFLRAGRGARAAAAARAAVVITLSSFDVLRGCERLHPSR